MFDIGWGELLVIGVVALVVVGPKELPRMLRTVGRYTAHARRMASDFQRSMEDAAREADLGDMKEMRDVAGHLRDIRSLPARSLDSFGRQVSAPAATPPAAPAATPPAAPAPGTATAATPPVAPPAAPTPPTSGTTG